MTKELLDLGNIGLIIIVVWAVFTLLSLQKNYIKQYKKVSLLFFGGTLILFLLYFNNIKPFFVSFTFAPFYLLLLFYCSLFLVYHSMRKNVDFSLVEKLETKKVYFGSISYRYIIYKSFDIVFQQIALLCLLVFLRDLAIPSTVLVLLFAVSFAINHLFMLKRSLLIGLVFIFAAFLGGIIFPFLLNLPYGVVYTYIIHWLFYIALGVGAHSRKKLHAGLSLHFI